MNRLDDVLRYKRDPQVDPSQDGNVAADGAVKLSGSLELKEVSFGYSKLDPPLIEKFSLTLKPGQRVALVGARQREIHRFKTRLRPLSDLVGRDSLRWPTASRYSAPDLDQLAGAGGSGYFSCLREPCVTT